MFPLFNFYAIHTLYSNSVDTLDDYLIRILV